MTRFRGFTRLMVAAILAGLLSGLGAILFHYLADTFGDELFRWAESNETLHRLSVVVIVPTVGLFFVGMILQLVPIARYGGVRKFWRRSIITRGWFDRFASSTSSSAVWCWRSAARSDLKARWCSSARSPAAGSDSGLD